MHPEAMNPSRRREECLREAPDLQQTRTPPPRQAPRASEMARCPGAASGVRRQHGVVAPSSRGTPRNCVEAISLRRARMLGPCAGGARLLALVFCAAIGLPLALSQIAQLTAFSPANGPSSGGSTFTIHGLHFGLGTSVVKARISGTACKSTKWISDTSMRAVTSGAGISFQDAIVVTFAGVVVHTENSAFTFDAPVLSATGGNSPAHAAGTLTLTGNGFGIYDTSPKARIGDTACLSTKWASYNRITCTIPPGTASGNGKSASMVLSVASSAAGKKTVSKAFSYDVPSITALFDGTGAMANGPAAGGNTITATGENFGTYDATSVAIIGGTSGGSIWTSDTSMGIVVAAGVQAGHAVAISMDSQYGSGLSTAYDYDPPAVSTLSLANGPATGAESLTVFGLNFGTADYSPLVSLGGKVCASSTWRSDSEIVCVTPTNVGSANDVDLIMLSKASTLSSSYSYDAPSVTSVHVANAPPMGTIVASIMGKNFGTDGSKHIARGKILSSKGGGVCSSSQRASDNLLLCTIPPGAGGDAEVTVDYVGGKAEDIGTLTLAFTYDAPVVLIFDPMFAQQLNVAPGTQTEITITGTNFGTADYDAIAMVGDTVCTSTTWKSDTALMCTVAEGFGDTHAIVVSLESKFNTYTDAVSYDKPAIAQMIPQNGPAGAETEITLLGLNFGSSQYTQTVKVGASMASNVRWTSDSAIVCAAPMGRGVALTVAVDQFLDDGDGGAHEGYFTYDDPVVTGTSLTNGPQSGGFVITVSGASFGGNLQGNFEMYVGASVCNAASWHSDSSIECELQPGFGRVDLSLRLWPSQTYCTGHQGLCLASHVGAFVYDGPNPTGLEGTMNGPSSGSNIVTVTGTLFGVTDPGVELIAKIGETNCSSTTWVSPTSLSCNVNPGVGSRDVHVYLAGVTNGIKRAYSYNAPTLDAGAWSVSEGPQAGGVLIPVTGTNFGDQAGHSESGISIDGVDCNIAEWISSSSVIVSSAPGVKQPGGNVVKIGAPGALPEELTKIGDWSFHQPMILGANPTQIPGLEEGNNLTVTGVNFGGFDSSPTIFIGSEDKACASSMWVSDSAIICSTPLNTDGKKDVAYLSGAKGSTGKDLKLELDASVVANNVTVLQAASNGSNSTELNVSAAYAARANKLVEFLDVPKHVLSFVSIAVTADQCDRDTTVDIGMGITMELKAGWCIADSIGEGSNMVAYVTSSASAPFSRDSANSTVPASQVLLGLAFRSVTLAGPVEVKAPLDLNMISQSVERRRRLLQYGGKILKQAWLNQCTGNWEPICAGSVSTDSVTSSISETTVSDACFNPNTDVNTCAALVESAGLCGKGGQVMAIAYSEEPCPGQAEEEEISWLPIIIGIIAGIVALAACMVLLVRTLNRGDDADSSYDSESDTGDSSLDADFVFQKSPPPSMMMPQPFMPASAVFSQYQMPDPTYGGGGMNPIFPMQNQLANPYIANQPGMQAGMLNPFGGGMGSPTPLSNQMTMMNRASSPVTGYGQGPASMGMYPIGSAGYMGGGERFGGVGFAGGYTNTPQHSPGTTRLDEREM